MILKRNQTLKISKSNITVILITEKNRLENIKVSLALCMPYFLFYKNFIVIYVSICHLLFTNTILFLRKIFF